MRVIVTGGSRGVGRGIALCFLKKGADVTICSRKTPDTPPECEGNTARCIAVDLRNPEDAHHFITSTAKFYGGLDVLINNAGGAPPADAATASPRFSEAIIKLNLLAPLTCAQSANAIMQNQKTGGVILNIASIAGARPSPTIAAYGAAKAGLLNLTQSLAQEWAPKVRLNAITLGMVHTEFSNQHYGGQQGVKQVEETIPLKRMATPEDVGNACLWLASPAAAYVSGADLELHGGGERPPFLDVVSRDVVSRDVVSKK